MPYITVKQTPRIHQLSYDDIIAGEYLAQIVAPPNNSHISGTITRFYDAVPDEVIIKSNISGMIEALCQFNERHEELFKKNRKSLYYEFFIPKRSGGLRRIDAPHPPLMNALYDLKEIFETQFGVLYHTSAYAYVPGRSTIDAIKRHQKNESKWFLKTDCSDFFGSTSLPFVMKMLAMIFPFSEIVKSDRGKAALERAVSLCMLSGGLPQGTPISPMLTNLVMIPIDHELAGDLRKDGCVYTRYADDMIISSRKSFMFTDKVNHIKSVFVKYGAPYDLKREKTRYGSTAGANWNLGVMLNQKNEITIGYRKRELFRSMCASYIDSVKKNQPWELRDIQVFSGLISYYMMVEPQYISEIIRKYERKFGINVMNHTKDALR